MYENEDFEDDELELVYNPQYYKLRLADIEYCYNKYISIKIIFYSGDIIEGKIKRFTEDEFTIVIPVNENLNEYVIKTFPVSEIRITEYKDTGNNTITTLIDDFNQKN